LPVPPRNDMTQTNEPALVIFDDVKDIREGLAEAAQEAGVLPISCETPKEALDAIDKSFAEGSLVGVLSDLRCLTGGREWGGWEVVSHAYRLSRGLRLAVYTGYANLEVHELFRSGAAMPAFGIFLKPDDYDKVCHWMVELRTAWDRRLSITVKDADTKRVYEEIAPVYARSTLSILVLGPTGTGKEFLARHIHDLSDRAAASFVPINCGGLEPSLAFSELFGHSSGAFTDARFHQLGEVLRASGYTAIAPRGARESRTFIDWLRAGNPDMIERDGLWESRAAEQAAGTLFLDEVATVPPKVMAGLLRVLSSQDVVPFGHHGTGIRSYCRIIAATNEVNVLVDSLGGTDDGVRQFRRDLCYRLAGAVLTLAPLRDRSPEDIHSFVEAVVWQQLGMPVMPVDRDALDQIVELYQVKTDRLALQYQRGNFRTLRNLMHRAALIAAAENVQAVSAAHLQLAIQHGELLVRETASIDQRRHIREVFRHALQERHISVDEAFSPQELRTLTQTDTTAIAYAFLKCATASRFISDPKRTYYELGEIEMALTGMSHNVWLNATLTATPVRAAAIAHFGMDASALGEGAKISEVVKAVQRMPRKKSV